jgi:hypothetical protein
MPLYDIEYVTPLTLHTQQELAIAFTQLHVKRFKTPASFINVRFTDASGQVVSDSTHRYYLRDLIIAQGISWRQTPLLQSRNLENKG